MSENMQRKNTSKDSSTLTSILSARNPQNNIIIEYAIVLF